MSSNTNNTRPNTATSAGKTNAWSRPLPRRAPPGLSNNNNNNNGPSKNTSFSKPANTKPTSTPSSSSAAINNGISSNTRNALRYRFLQLQLSLVGQSVTLTLKDGSVLQGVLHTSTPFDNLDKKYKGASGLTSFKNQYVLKAVKVVKDNTSATTNTSTSSANVNANVNASDSISLDGVKHGSTVIIPVDKVVSLHAKSLRLEDHRHQHGRNNGGNNNNSSNIENDPFKTDTDISHGGMVNSGDLVHAGNAWTSAPSGSNNNTNINGTLEDFSLEGGNHNKYSRMNTGTAGGGGGSNTRGGLFKSSNATSSNNAISAITAGGLNSSKATIEDWDQFSANEKKFGIKATFDEDLYTTSLDKTNIDSKKKMEAERLAREIESTTSSNIHIAEERGHKIEGDFDEEDLYSGVLVKDSNKNNNSNSEASGSGPVKERKQLVLKPRTVDKPTSTTATSADSTAKDKTTQEPQAKSTNEKKNEGTGKNVPAKSTAPPNVVKKMNYAAAAASSKMETTTTTKAAPSSKQTENKPTPTVRTTTSNNKEKATKPIEITTTTTETKKEETNATNVKDEEREKESEKPKSKLNPNAAKFVFNPSAAEWKPTFGGGVSSGTTNNGTNDQQQQQPAQQQQQPVPPTEPQHAMGAVQMPQYMHYQQMHPPMMPAAYQPYAAMPHRVGPPQYGMMPMAGGGGPMNGAPEGAAAVNNNTTGNSNLSHPEANNGAAVEGNTKNTATEADESKANNNPGVGGDNNDKSNNEGNAGDDSKKQQQPPVQHVGNPQQQQQQVPQQQQPVPVNYVSHGGPSGYYQQPGMPIPGRGPMQQYHPQMVGGPQQIPVQPGQPYYMPQMHQQNMSQYQMRGNFPHAPYMQQGYNGAPRPGGHGMMEEDGGYRGNGGRGRGGRGPGRNRGGRRNNGGRGENKRYSNNGYANNSNSHQNDQQDATNVDGS